MWRAVLGNLVISKDRLATVATFKRVSCLKPGDTGHTECRAVSGSLEV